MRQVLSTCIEAPDDYTTLGTVEELMAVLAREPALPLAFALLINRNCEDIDPVALRRCKLDYPQINYLLVLEQCAQHAMLRFQSVGVQGIILPPFDEVNLEEEIATALPNLPQFKRNPDLMKRGLVRLDFSIPSDLGYVLGVNHMISLLLKEFGFPPTDCRINIPLACDEAITNAIIHGNGSDSSKKVGIQIYVSASRFKIRIRDQGSGFDVAGVDNPTKGEALLRASGRGVYLMHTIMDSVQYKDGGRVVELEKENKNGSPAATLKS